MSIKKSRVRKSEILVRSRPVAALLAATLALLLSAAPGCDQKGQPGRLEKISLAVSPWPASSAVYIAQEKGYFREEGLEVTLHNYISGHLGLNAMLAGKEDMATAGESPIARAALEGKPISVVATICEIDQAILVIARKDRGISSLSDLKGKKIGLAATSAADYFLHVFLTTNGMDPREVRIINMAPDKAVASLLKGEVDAVSTWSPHTSVLRDKLGDNALVLGDPGLYTLMWNLVAAPDYIKNNPERVRKLLRAIVRANRFITDSPGKARVASRQYIGTESPFLEKEWGNYRFLAVLDQSLILNMEDQARWMIKREGMRHRMPNFLDFIYTEGLNTVKPDAVRIAGKQG